MGDKTGFPRLGHVCYNLCPHQGMLTYKFIVLQQITLKLLPKRKTGVGSKETCH